jgi:hypothetical protein
LPLYEFRCQEGHTTEARASRETTSIFCACGAPAARQSVYRVGVSGFARTPLPERHYGKQFKAFQEASGELEYQASRQTNLDGSERPTPPLWQTAKVEAKRLERLGVRDSADLK